MDLHSLFYTPHHSGIPDIPSTYVLSSNELTYKQILTKLKGDYLTSAPNTIYNYSSLALALLGGVIEKTSGKTYEEYIKEKFLTPLDMKSTKIQATFKNGYDSDGNEVSMPFQKAALPTMGLISNIADMSKFLMFINNHSQMKNPPLKAQSLKEMTKIQNKDIALDLNMYRGLGWGIDTNTFTSQNPIYFHSGTVAGFKSFIASMPNYKLGVIILSNTTNDEVESIAYKALKLAYEYKTKQKYIIPKIKKLKIIPYEIQGTYNTNYFGKIDIIKQEKNKFILKSLNDTYRLIKNNDGSYITP